MAKPSKTAKLVVTSIVITLIVLAAFTLVFINFIVPAYQITEEQIYSVLTRLFPVLIGLILIQIGVMAAKKGEPEYKDTIDKLSPNAYDSALYTEPKDDPAVRGRIDPAAYASGAVREVVKEVPVEVVKEVPVEVIKEVPVEKIREVQVPVEVIREVPVDRIVEKEVIREVEKEVPVEVVKEVPVEVIKEVKVESEAAAPVYLSFHDVLREEAKAAAEMDYDLSLVAIKERDGLTEEGEDGCFFAVLPLYSKDEAEKATENLEPRNVATISGTEIEPEAFIAEAARF